MHFPIIIIRQCGVLLHSDNFRFLQREQLERAHSAAEVLAAKHKAAAWQAKLQQQAADMAAYAQHSAPGQVTSMQKHLLAHPALVLQLTTCDKVQGAMQERPPAAQR